MNDSAVSYDVVIIGAGISGAIVAKQLALLNKDCRVLLLESGAAIPNGREALMERFFLDVRKFPEAPYPAPPQAPRATVQDLLGDLSKPEMGYLDQSEAKVPFGSTYERRAGGTGWHWMGTSLRLMPKDFAMKSAYGHAVDWPITYKELALDPRHDCKSYYDMAEDEIGVSASVEDQDEGGKLQLFRDKRNYPNPAIPSSKVDQFFENRLNGGDGVMFEGMPVKSIRTPAGRNSQPYQNRRICAGNTNCVPICPIEAKYDPTVTLHAALNNRGVQAEFHCVATKLLWNQAGNTIDGVEYVKYDPTEEHAPSPREVVRAKVYVLAANGIESPKLLLMSGFGRHNPAVGQNLMDHPFYLRWGLAPEPIYPYRGPLSTSGLDGLRDGEFRRKQAAFRIEIGNDGWALSGQDPARTLLDHLEGDNESLTNPNKTRLFGRDLVKRLNYLYTRQCRIGFEIEQLPDPANAVTLSSYVDALGLPKPKIAYSMSEYEAAGFRAAAELTDQLFAKLKIEDKTTPYVGGAHVESAGKKFPFMGAGHVMGTCAMGEKGSSVVDKEQCSHDAHNLFIVGSSVFPTVGTANPTLTIAALAFWAADSIHKKLGQA